MVYLASTPTIFQVLSTIVSSKFKNYYIQNSTNIQKCYKLQYLQQNSRNLFAKHDIIGKCNNVNNYVPFPLLIIFDHRDMYWLKV